MSGWGAGYPGVPSDVAKKARRAAAHDRNRPPAHTPEPATTADAAPEAASEDRRTR